MRRLLLALVVITGACSSMPTRGATEAVITAAVDGAVPDLPAGTAPRPSGAVPPATVDAPFPDLPDTDAAETTVDNAAVSSDVSVERSPLAELVRPIGSAVYDPGEHVAAAKPLTISIPELGVDSSPIDPVGVTNEGELDVPDPLVVGWYEGSPIPGANGASVLAAHVNFDGVPGVFRYLRDLDGGEVVEIGYEDGSTQTFEITAVDLYDKDELPEDRVWAKDGDPTLVLFTCGGRYNRAQRSYEDNVVAFARPVVAD